MSFEAFMMQNVKTVDERAVVVGDRFVDEEGKPIPFKLKAITSDYEARIRKMCMVDVPVKKGVKTKQLDQDAFMSKMVATCVTYPDLKNEQLQNSYGVRGEEELLKKMLLPGEYAELLMATQEINGYAKDMNELVEEAKN